jgi:hypothetical protein
MKVTLINFAVQEVTFVEQLLSNLLIINDR